MKITICSSIYFEKQGFKVKKQLEELGHNVFIYPNEVTLNNKTMSVEDFYKARKSNLNQEIMVLKTKLMKDHIKKIEESDAILVLNYDKQDKEGYIGGNTFLEMAIANYINKKIFVWKNPGKDLPYFEEIASLNPIVIKQDLKNIK